MRRSVGLYALAVVAACSGRSEPPRPGPAPTSPAPRIATVPPAPADAAVVDAPDPAVVCATAMAAMTSAQVKAIGVVRAELARALPDAVEVELPLTLDGRDEDLHAGDVVGRGKQRQVVVTAVWDQDGGNTLLGLLDPTAAAIAEQQGREPSAAEVRPLLRPLFVRRDQKVFLLRFAVTATATTGFAACVPDRTCHGDQPAPVRQQVLAALPKGTAFGGVLDVAVSAPVVAVAYPECPPLP